jgi:CheY-like chemotaxis protein
MDIAFIMAIGTLAYRTNTNFTAMVRLNLEKDMLMEKLRREKERAEEANLAKSRFLASASHDLRQPMHALSLFIGALSSHPMNAEMRGLVEHIEGSITAMDGLFGSLLDISRIDAGIVQPQFEAFELQPLLQRLCEDHAGEAHGKGNHLQQVPCAATIYTDPVLLERILRNVISNAVRYTDHGRILVGGRRGKRLSIEIHDTGCGIPFEEQDRIFEEFYQIKNPERDRTKGLGLGLAIVKRLALVLECPFELKSQPGKGTLFKLSVPVLDSPHLYPLPAKTAVTDVAGRGLILVVDDEVAVQEGMRSLLCSWGYDVIIAGSCAQMIAEISNCHFRADLIICDYRLRDGENGIDVILRLQSEYNEEIPAVLVTGDTAPDRLVEAMASGFALLHKPVSNAKLRATIRGLMNA